MLRRSNSTFYMLQRFIELSSTVNDLLLSKPQAPPMLTAVEMLEIKETIALPKPIEYMTVEASGEQYITISKIIPMINCAKNVLQSIQPELEVSKQLKIDLEDQLERRFGQIESVSLILYLIHGLKTFTSNILSQQRKQLAISEV